MKAKNEIKGISFVRDYDGIGNIARPRLELHLVNEIPAMGYGPKEIIKMLKLYAKPWKEKVKKNSSLLT